MFWSLCRSAASPSWYAFLKLPSSRLTWARLEHRMELSAASLHPTCSARRGGGSLHDEKVALCHRATQMLLH